MKGAQRLDHRRLEALGRRRWRHGVQVEITPPVEHVGGRQVALGAGEFDAVEVGTTQVFFAGEGQDVEVSVDAGDSQGVAAVVEEGRHGHVHCAGSLTTVSAASAPSTKRRVIPSSWQ